MTLPTAAAWLALDKLTTADAVGAAHEALERGVYCQALGEVILVEPVLAEVVPRFARALGELGVAVPGRAAAV